MIKINQIALFCFFCLDPTTLYRAKTEYQSEFDRFLKTKLTGEKQKNNLSFLFFPLRNKQ